ncbi:hypothetical protein [Streptomyces sp. NPDC004135]
MSEANLKRLVAYLFCTLFALLGAGISAVVVGVLGAPALFIAGAGGGGFIAVMGLGVKIIGPFEFTADNPETPPAQPRQGAPSP